MILKHTGLQDKYAKNLRIWRVKSASMPQENYE